MIRGSCLCGGVKYQINGLLSHARHCHCSMCRKAQGAAFRSRASAKATEFEWLQGENLVTFYESSPGNHRGFCRVCGSPVVTKFSDAKSEYCGVPLGPLDDDPGVRPELHVHVASKAPWYTITDDLPQFAALPVKSQVTPMPQTIHRGIKSLIDEANAEIETLSAAEAIKAAQGDDVVIVDIRDPREIEREGRIPGAFSCTRGMLEFWIDPASPYAKPIFQSDKKFIFHCAGGMRSALAAKTAQDMGLKPVAHLGGGFAAWRDAGGPVEKFEPKKPKG
jgi:rhodanese-related sulfurtransferase